MSNNEQAPTIITYPGIRLPSNLTKEQLDESAKATVDGFLGVIGEIRPNISNFTENAQKSFETAERVADIFKTVSDDILQKKDAGTVLSNAANNVVTAQLDGFAKAAILDAANYWALGKNIVGLTPIAAYSALFGIMISLGVEAYNELHSQGIMFTGYGSNMSGLQFDDITTNRERFLDLTTTKKVGLPDPIVINLGDQEGFDTKSLAESDAYFDTNQNGFAEKTGWIGENSGILTRDVNGNGVIDGGAEVFGDSTILSDGTKAATGFDALRDLDSNGDGIISAEDAMYDTLRVWRDDGDGISQSEELKTLSELGIKSISLDSETVNSTDGKGNTITRTSNVEFSDGTIRKAGEFLFNTNTIDTESAATYTGTFEIPDEIKLLPFLDGISNIDDLHTAMAKDAVLLTLVQDYINETDASFDAYAA